MYMALHNKLPVYNCGDNDTVSLQSMRDNMACYGIPSCKGFGTFNKEYFDLVTPEDREADIIQFIQTLLVEKMTKKTTANKV